MTPLSLRARLFAMMLLEYAVWGAWAAMAGKYFTDPAPKGLGFPGSLSGLLFCLLPLASVISPLFAGQLADRHVRSERLLGVLCLVCSGLLISLSMARQEAAVLTLMVLYALCFAPTAALANSIAFQHLADPSREFGKVRVGGTAGWFVALGVLAAWRSIANYPGDLFALAGIFSLILGIYSFTLPATPPQHVGSGIPFVKALGMLHQPNFRVFAICVFVLACSMDVYYIFSSAYLGTPTVLHGVGLVAGQVPLVMMLPQCSELVVMSTLGSTLPKLGIKRAMLIGFSAWILRYVLYAAFPTGLGAAAALLMHGFCFTFVLAVASLYINEIASPTIRASAQSLPLGLVGLGRFVGSELAGVLHDSASHPIRRTIDNVVYHQQVNWAALFGSAGILAAIATLGLAIFFREPRQTSASAG